MTTSPHFTPRQLMLASMVIFLWGMNFVVIKIGLRGVPPFLMGALRFILVAFPAIFFLPRPRIPFKLILAYGLTISLGQFAFLFLAMAVGMPAGLASLVLQAQAFFTVLLGALIFRDKLKAQNLLGMLIAAAGIVLLSKASLSASTTQVTLAGFALTLCAALSWASGNIINKKIGVTNVLSLVSWGALIPILPFLLLSYYFEGADKISQSLHQMNWPSFLSVAYIAYAATLVGYSIWGRLLASLPTATVAPMTLMVPVIGLSSAWLLVGEALQFLQILGAITIMLGLVINVFGSKLLLKAGITKTSQLDPASKT